MSKSITLFLEAHGDEKLSTRVNVPRVKLLSFSGKPGELGDFGEINGVSLEIHILQFLRSLYSQNDQKTVYDNEELLRGLRSLYTDKAGKGYTNGGFVRTTPKNQRNFYFQPNEHEDCRLCNDLPVTDPFYRQICLPIRDSKTKLCPVYGLIVVASSDEDDSQFTLIRDNIIDDSIESLSSSNLHMSLSAQKYWYSKIDKVKFPIAAGMFTKMINDKNVSLTELSQIFQAMGYTDIYILDPSCRDTRDTSTNTKTSTFKTAALSVMERGNPKISRVSDAVTSYTTRPSIEEPEPDNIDDLWSTTCKMGSQCWENMFGKTKIDGGRKSKKQRKNKIFKFTKLNKTTKRRNKNKTKKHK